MVLVLLGTGAWFYRQSWLKIPEDLVFTTINGKKISMTDLRGKPVLINFWATDCPSCIQEISALKNLYAQYHSQGLEMIGITMYYDIPNHVVEMVKRKQISYPVSLDLKGKYAKIFGNIELTPTTLLLNTEGRIISTTTGLLDVVAMEATIKGLLKRRAD